MTITPWAWPYHETASRWACQGVRSLAASPDGRTLWVAHQDRVDGFDVATGRVAATVPSVAAGITVLDDEVITYERERTHWRRVAGAWELTRTEPLAASWVIAVARDVPGALLVGERRRVFWDTQALAVDTADRSPSAALDPRGERCALLGRDRVDTRGVYVFGRGSGAPLACRGVNTAFSPRLAWAGDDLLIGGLGLTCYATGAGAVRWRAEGFVGALATSRDGKTAAVLSHGNAGAQVALVRVDDGAIIARWLVRGDRLEWRCGDVTRTFDAGANLRFASGSWPLEIAPDGAWCAAAFESGLAVLGTRGELLGLPQGGEGRAGAIAWLPDGRIAVGYNNSGSIRVLRPDATEADLRFEHDGAETCALSPSPDGRMLAASEDASERGLNVFDLRDGAPLSVATTTVPHPDAMAWDDEGVALWIAHHANGRASDPFELWRFDVTVGAARRVWSRETRLEPYGMRLLQRAGRGLYAILSDAVLALDPCDGSVQTERRWPTPEDTYEDSFPGRFVVDARRVIEEHVGCWDLDRGEALWTHPPDGPFDERVEAIGPSRRWLLTHSSHDRGELRVRAARGGELLCSHPTPYGQAFALSGDGRWLAVVVDGVPHLYRVDVDAIEAACDALEG